MQITHIIPGDLWAGAESQVFYLIKELIKRSDQNISVIIFNKGELYNRLSDLSVRLHFVSEAQNSSFVMCTKIMEILNAESHHILHVHEYKSHILASIAKALTGSDCAIVRTLHGRSDIPFNIKLLKTYLVFKIEHAFLKYYTQSIIAVSVDIQSMLEEKYSRVKITHINNAVSITPNQNIDITKIKKKYHVEENEFWVGTAARLVDVKNLDMLIDVASILKGKISKSFKVSIFGDGPLKHQLENRIHNERLGDVISIHGHNDEILPVLQCLDTFVLTSKHEGLPMSLLEAMTLGTVPVCTRVGGPAEVIQNEINGILVESGDAEQMSVSIIRLVNNEKVKNSLAMQAMLSMQKNYAIDQSVEKLVNTYKTIT